ncbi:MAG: sporulation integral membrane protein YlbJ [Firmicutes bacterium]|jgi:sporulation integral membrane protein YlbJ|nr:sporulation integral membrane protein YlbJ [Bacillota bacterium]MDH7494894.1 sporulation integral membrane protein YlbJ [Bacillota bacterium]
MGGRATTRRATYLTAACAAVVTIAIIIHPDVAFEASVEGLRLWWEVVFPALLPFFIASEALMALGVVHFLGVLLEPLMRPMFDVPGVGAFAFAMGLTGGYPIGARITANLRKQDLCNRIEGERLVSFTNTADPLFMAGAVAVGMFGVPSLAPTICGAHYISAVIVGVLLRLHGGPQMRRGALDGRKENIFSRAFNELYRAREADGRTLGQLLGDTVRDSVNSMLLVGGFIIMFSVIIRVLTVARMTELLAVPLTVVLSPLGLDPALVPALVSGFFEITLGSELASKAAAPLIQRLVAANAIIAWSGLSVFAQVTTMCSGTDIRMAPYVAARVLQAAISAAVTILLMSPVGRTLAQLVVPAFVAQAPGGRVSFVTHIGVSFSAFARLLGLMIVVSLVIWSLRRIRVVTLRVKSRTTPSSSVPRRRV